ncbi:hypothetical protein Y032_0528g2986 [Ancylostoma ceylanicum]|uniref:Uncharacterized protein n=1 Tax=Ancylostoma ceylanicum TaxID=53326 RepID=A0A016WSE8_9BILA|nr:hypothetical protein Y032_0528g2986 [Ancylostoma ceylanicum]
MAHAQLCQCKAYARGLQLIEDTIFHPERTLFLTDEEHEEYRIAEEEISEATAETVAVMFSVRRPATVCMTTASLLNATATLGIFKAHLLGIRTIIYDMASQISPGARLCCAHGALPTRSSHLH